MTKKALLNLGMILGVLIILGGILYFFFPKIWGDILFPLEYNDYIAKYSKEYNLDPSFVAAVIYSESHFNTDSVSRAGARGLMQIMPATGASIAKRIGDDSYTPDKLFDPETNIRYGCWYLRYLLDNYQEDESAALAGYNGGGAVGDRYVIAREAGIPTETQGYIKTVLFAKEMYKKLYSNEFYVPEPENVTEKLQTRPAYSPTFIEKIINFFKEKVSGQ